MENIEYIEDLFEFLEASPVNFLAVETARRKLEAAGFEALDMRDEWTQIGRAHV